MPERCRFTVSGRPWPRLPALLCLALLLVMPAAGHAGDITISGARADITNGIVMLSADAELAFSDDAIAALNSGIPLVFELDVRIMRKRRFWWDPQLVATQRRFSIERHALSEQFVLIDLITEERRVHDSLAAAVADLGRLRDLPVVDHTEIADAPDQDFRIRMRLDLESLPAPMLPLAYLSPGWRMSSGWHRWQTAL